MGEIKDFGVIEFGKLLLANMKLEGIDEFSLSKFNYIIKNLSDKYRKFSSISNIYLPAIYFIYLDKVLSDFLEEGKYIMSYAYNQDTCYMNMRDYEAALIITSARSDYNNFVKTLIKDYKRQLANEIQKVKMIQM